MRTPANGTPAIARPMPASTDWPTAVTTTPSATPRIAWPASTTAFSPAVPGHAPREAAQAVGRGVAEVVEDGGDDHRHQELEEERADAPERRRRTSSGPDARTAPPSPRGRARPRPRSPATRRRPARRRAGSARPRRAAAGSPRFEAGRPSRRSPPGSRGASRAPRGTARRRGGGARSSGRPSPDPRRPPKSVWSFRSTGHVATTIVVAQTSAAANGATIQSESARSPQMIRIAKTICGRSNRRSFMDVPLQPITLRRTGRRP